MALGMNDPDSTMEHVMKNIYSSCDPHNLNEVPTSKLIEFIMPYMLEDLSALENLKSLLDPDNKNVHVNSEEFYQVMNEWAKKFTSPSDDDFNTTPSQLDVIDEKHLPYSQSTPRASFGQKLLRCEGLLLNLSNESIYNLSASTHTKENNTVGTEKTVLEEEVKKLDHQLHKVLSEMEMVKMQLAQSEEQNENLHADLERCRTRLLSEQQLNDHLHKNKCNSEELKEEISFGKKRIEELNKKLLCYEKENAHLENYLQKIEKENTELEERLDNYKRMDQDLKKEMFDMKTELDMKDLEVASLSKLNDELKLKLAEKKNLVDQLTSENELLDYKKQGLEKILSSRRYSTASSHYTTCLADESSFLKGTVPIYSSPPPPDSFFAYNSPAFLKRVLAPVSPGLGSPIYPLNPLKKKLVSQLNSSTPKAQVNRTTDCFDIAHKSHSLTDLNLSTRSMPDIPSANGFRDANGFRETNGFRDRIGGDDVFGGSPSLGSGNVPFMSLQAELFQVDNIFDYKLKNGATCDSCLDYEDRINSLKVHNESLQSKFHELTEENKRLNADLVEISKETEELKMKLTHTVFEKCAIQESLKEMQNLTNKTEKENIFIDLKEKINILNANLVSKENELEEFKKKFSFETAYKSSQMELNERNNELSELKQSHQRSKEANQILTNKIQELEKALQLSKAELRENEDKTKQMLALNHNIEQTANQVQEHINNKSSVLLDVQELNRKFQDTIKTLEKQLHDRTAEIDHLRTVLKSDEDIKNMMWRNHKKVYTDLENLKLEHDNVSKQLEESESVRKDLKEEYNALLAKYNEETVKNVELSNQLSDLKKELSNAEQKYNEETEKNITLHQQVTVLKNEVQHIRNNQKDDKERINKKLSDYESHMQNLEKINEDLKAEMEIERHKVKEDKISEELCNNLSHFQKMLVNLETQISDLENEKVILRSELECERRKTKKDSEGDISSESSSLSFNTTEKLSLEPKNRSFEKQKLTIDRLKDRLEHLQSQLLNEKSRCEVLRKMLTSAEEKQVKMAQELEQSNLEQNNSQSAINELTAKLKSQEDNYKQMCHKSNEKLEEISQKLVQLEQRNTNLLTDLAHKDTLIKQYLDDNKISKSVIENLNEKMQESDNRHHRIFAELATKEIQLKTVSMENIELKNLSYITAQNLNELTSKCAQLESDVTKSQAELKLKNEEVISFINRVCEKDTKIQLLLKTIHEQEEKLSQAFLELTQKELEYKAFLEKVSKTDDHKEKELLDTEQRIKNNTVALESMDSELKEMREHVCQKKDELENVSEKIFGFMNVISDCSKDLSRAVSLTTEKWEIDIENDENLPSLKMCQTLEVEEGLLVLNDNVKVAVSLLEILSTRAPSTMDDSENQITVISNVKQLNCNDSKNVKKFTLRPSRLILNRPVSPDSPSVDLDLPSESPNVECDREFDSPDSHNHEEVFETSNSMENGIEDHSYSRLPNLPLDLSFNDAFPNVSDNFLEKLGLQESSPKMKLSRDETEKLFTTFAIQIALDSRDIKDRLHRQKLICSRQHRKCFYLIKDISMRLRDHRCIGASDPINPVFVLLEDVRFLLQEIVQSSGQLGILTCENRMAKCWNLVTNYMAMLKQGPAKAAQKKIPTNKSREDRPKLAVEENKKQIKNGTQRKTSDKPTIAKEAKEEMIRHRRNWFTCIALSAGWVLLFAFLFLTVLISIHWQCRMTTDHQVCPLDDFIKKIQIGTPPY